jgi:hypothetical protein
VSLHNLDVVRPLFPNVRSRQAALRRLFDGPVMLDSAGVMQQSICYDAANRWTVSVAWGFVVTVARGVMPAREMEMPARTFLNWYRRADYKSHAFNTRPLARNQCEKPALYYLASARRTVVRTGETTVTRYQRWRHRNELRPPCRWNIPDPDALLDTIIVLKKPDPGLWDRVIFTVLCLVLSTEHFEFRFKCSKHCYYIVLVLRLLLVILTANLPEFAVADAELLQGAVLSEERRGQEQDDDHRRGCVQ